MGIIRENIEKHIGISSFLKYLIETDKIEGSALGIAKQVIDKGESSLSIKQQEVFNEYVLEPHIYSECSYCGAGKNKVSWEDYITIHRDGECDNCQGRLNAMYDE